MASYLRPWVRVLLLIINLSFPLPLFLASNVSGSIFLKEHYRGHNPFFSNLGVTSVPFGRDAHPHVSVSPRFSLSSLFLVLLLPSICFAGHPLFAVFGIRGVFTSALFVYIYIYISGYAFTIPLENLDFVLLILYYTKI